MYMLLYLDTISDLISLAVASPPYGFACPVVAQVCPALARSNGLLPAPPKQRMLAISGRPFNVIPGTHGCAMLRHRHCVTRFAGCVGDFCVPQIHSWRLGPRFTPWDLSVENAHHSCIFMSCMQILDGLGQLELFENPSTQTGAGPIDNG